VTKTKSDPKLNVVAVTLNPADHTRLRIKAAEAGKPMTVLARDVVLKWLEGQDQKGAKS
jgi:hypothetical protein